VGEGGRKAGSCSQARIGREGAVASALVLMIQLVIMSVV
jgi:hypothetical protein